MLRAPLLSCLIVAGVAAPAVAQTAVGEFEAWMAVTDPRGGGKVCYAVSRPTEMKPETVRRGDVWLLVSHRPKDKVRDEVRIVMGYPLAETGKVAVAVGTAQLQFFPDGEDAWAPTPQDDKSLVAAMKRGSTLTVEATSTRGTKTSDSYSLAGFTAAYNAIGKECGVE